MDHVDRCFDVLAVEYYVPENDQWTTVSPMRAGQSEAGCCLLDRKIYVIGGYNWHLNNQRFSKHICEQLEQHHSAAFQRHDVNGRPSRDQSFTHAFMQFYFAQLQLQKTQYLQLGQNRGQYYGGSLPNVNQIGNGNIDLPFQNSVLDTSRTTRHHGLVERVYRDRNRITSPHRRPLSSVQSGNCELTSPLSNTSRTNSDSALHQS
ncbi:unnamed protein product, partial [Lampetra planeri]